MNAKPKLSNTEKMKISGGKVASWSLVAGEHCPASTNSEVCRSCYAMRGRYRFDNVKAPRYHNFEDCKNYDWVDVMVASMRDKKLTHFRWFDSGDVINSTLAKKIQEVIKLTPEVKHWLPTRMDKIPSVNSVLAQISDLPNVCVRPSNDNFGLTPDRDGVLSFVIDFQEISPEQAEAEGVFVCPVTVNSWERKRGVTDVKRVSCGDCTMCYQKGVKVAYGKH